VNKRDLKKAAADLGRRCERDDVWACERTSRLFWVEAGLAEGGFGVFEPVIRRRVFSRRWRKVADLDDALGRLEEVLRHPNP
jgi:hypothetical protein